jgi:glycosyltransferase involved in cell wall biosynthesis
MSDRRLLVIVPAWNEEACVGTVVKELFRVIPTVDVLVVNDGSTDRTSAVARAAGAKVVDFAVNLGVGAAMRAGYKYALRHGYTHTAQHDADGQHDPEAIEVALSVMEAEQADIVIGARFAGVRGYTVRGPRRWAMRILSRVLSVIAHTKLTDATSGFRVCDEEAIRLYAENYPAEYLGDTVESTVIAARAGLKIRQVGVSMRPRAAGQPSQNPLRAGAYLARALLALVVALSRPKKVR